MKLHTEPDPGAVLIGKARELGADLAGMVRIEDLKIAPSFSFAPIIAGSGDEIGTRKSTLGLKPGEVHWPNEAKTVMVIAVHHPEEKPELDWWYGKKDPPGNRELARIVRELCEWIPANLHCGVVHLPYHIERGGTYLKDAASLAGLGCIGRNNILVTPEFGPRVRLRALTLDIELPSTGPIDFDPCGKCADLCRKACPQKAFERQRYSAETHGQAILPGRDGTFARPTCNERMEMDNEEALIQYVDELGEETKIVKYCRRCELACPVGKQRAK